MKKITQENDNFDKDIESMQKDLNNISSPLASIDVQNQIWIKIITREKMDYEIKIES